METHSSILPGKFHEQRSLVGYCHECLPYVAQGKGTTVTVKKAEELSKG